MITLSGFSDEISEYLEEQIRVIKKLNISHIECRGVNGNPLISYSLSEAEAIKQQLDKAGIRLSSIGSSIGKINITEDFNSHFKLFCHAVEIAKLMETRNIRIFSFFIPQGCQPEQYSNEVMKRLDILTDYAAKHNIVLLHENEKEIYGDTAPRCLEIMKRFYGEHFKAVFDFANFVQCDQETMEAWKLLKPYVAYIHIKDAKKSDKTVVPAGMGDGNVETILRELKASNYSGFLSLEPHLSQFTGFRTLEHGAEKKQIYSGEEAFTIAYNALNQLLKKVGF